MSTVMSRNGHNPDVLRREIEREREGLVQATRELEAKLKETTDVAARIKDNLPLLLVGALVVGFVLAGGVGATARYFFRRGREGDKVVEAGRFIVRRR